MAVAVVVVAIVFVGQVAEWIAVSVVELEFDYYRRLCSCLSLYDNQMVFHVSLYYLLKTGHSDCLFVCFSFCFVQFDFVCLFFDCF